LHIVCRVPLRCTLVRRARVGRQAVRVPDVAAVAVNGAGRSKVRIFVPRRPVYRNLPANPQVLVVEHGRRGRDSRHRPARAYGRASA
jgi:hypothetical protein